MAKPLLTDQLWERIESFIPSRPPRPQGGRSHLTIEGQAPVALQGRQHLRQHYFQSRAADAVRSLPDDNERLAESIGARGQRDE